MRILLALIVILSLGLGGWWFWQGSVTEPATPDAAVTAEAPATAQATEDAADAAADAAAIAADVARAHGGELQLGDSAGLGGLRAEIVLPR